MDDRHYATFGTISTATALIFVSCTLLAVPVDLFEGAVPMPYLPLLVIFLYGLDRPTSLPVGVTFIAGLYLDLLFGLALGPWSVTFLLTHATILWQRSYFAGRDASVLATGFAIILVAVMTIFWLLSSILAARLLPMGLLAYQALVTLAVFPFVLTLFRRVIAKQPVTLGG